MSQTQVQKSGAIKLGSAKVEVGDSIATLQNLGAMRGISLSESFDKIVVESDNAGVIEEYIKNQRVAIKGNLIEIDLEMLEEIRKGIDAYSPVAGSATPVTDEEVKLEDTDFKRLAFKNGDNSEVTSIVVTSNDPTPAARTRNTDYVIAVDSAGYTCIARIAGGAIGDGDTVLVDYSYTPNVSKKLTSGGKKTLTPRVVRLTNTDENNKKFQVTIYYATIEEGITLEFPSDEADDVMATLVNLVGKIDTTKTAGDQLYEMIDEQSVV